MDLAKTLLVDCISNLFSLRAEMLVVVKESHEQNEEKNESSHAQL